MQKTVFILFGLYFFIPNFYITLVLAKCMKRQNQELWRCERNKTIAFIVGLALAVVVIPDAPRIYEDLTSKHVGGHLLKYIDGSVRIRKYHPSGGLFSYRDEWFFEQGKITSKKRLTWSPFIGQIREDSLSFDDSEDREVERIAGKYSQNSIQGER